MAKQKKTLPRLAALCAVLTALALAGCSSATNSDSDDDVKPGALAGLTLKLDGGDSLITFNPGATGYTVQLDKEGTTMEVNALPDGDSTVTIKVDGAAKAENPASFPAPVTGKEAVTVEIIAGRKGSKTPVSYSIIIHPAQKSDGADSNLSSLDVHYTGGSTASLLSPTFTQSVTQYDANIKTDDTGYGSGLTVTAVASAHEAVIEIKDGDDDWKQGASAAIRNLPAAGKSKTIQIRVTQGDNKGSRIYYVTVSCIKRLVTWTGTVEYQGADGLSIKGIGAQDSDHVQKNGVLGEDLNFNGTKYDWTLQVDETFAPKYFIVALVGTGENPTTYRSGLLEPVIVDNDTPITVVVAGGAVGNTISDANELAAKLVTGANVNYALANDIDLNSYVDADGKKIPWVGPQGYNKTFYGNGFTITGLDLTKITNTKVGLFQSLGNNAVLQDFTVEATTGDTALEIPGNKYFGGIVGNPGSVIAELKNITIKGHLQFKVSGESYLLCGGLIGEMSSGNVTITNCVSELDIILDPGGTINNDQTLGFGGLVGKAYGNLSIKNSYATGAITAQCDVSRNLIAGGLIGDKIGGTLMIENSYAAGPIVTYMNPDSPAGRKTWAGGLVGRAMKSGSTAVTIKNSAALNASALARITTADASRSQRIIGESNADSPTYTNNFARTDMVIGNDPDTPKAAVDNADGTDGKSVNIDGEGSFKEKATWTKAVSEGGLGWLDSEWDFSGVKDGIWPTIKK